MVGIITISGNSLPLVGACRCWWVVVLGIRCHWYMVVSPHHCSVVVVGALHGLLMVVVGPCGWWLFCSSPLVGNAHGPLPSFVSSASLLCGLSMCCHRLLLLSVGGVMSLPGCVNDDGRQIIHCLSFDFHVDMG